MKQDGNPNQILNIINNNFAPIACDIKKNVVIIGGKDVQQGKNTDSEPTDGSAARTEDYVSPIKAFKHCINVLIDDGTITMPGDFCCIYKLEKEMSIVGFESFADFKDRIEALFPDLNSKLQFTGDHNKKFGWGRNLFPDWPWDNMPDSKAAHYRATSKCFVRIMGTQGFKHPNYKKIFEE